ncbi:autophagy-related protein 11-domain-containing protein [Ampelomyces quisqualis]|uniref:Autophagy-related protein 11 n=1 Tax=Ampelomyces quisqualis TaxID=50730 RepID=A0A6A5R5K5_AMPQU|nr:autophagy-related protein 11-domain-containing protein [Ampelomyces quisqualis]
MSLQIAVAHTGQRLDADPVAFSSVDALKHWISRASGIAPESQILLTPGGKHVKLQALLTEKEIFVYSRDVSISPQAAAPTSPLPDPFTPDDPPNTLSNNTDLGAWQALFQARRDWAFDMLQQSHSMSRAAAKYFTQQATIERGTQVAVGNHDSHIQGLHSKFKAAKEWFHHVEKEAGDNLRRLDADFGQLGAIPAKPDFVHFLAKEMRSAEAAQNARNTAPDRPTSLQDYLDVDAVKKATGTSTRVRESVRKRMAAMSSQLQEIGTDYQHLLGAVGQSQSRSLVDDSEEPLRLYNEIDAVAKKVESDFEHVMGLETSSKSVAQVSKMALLHTRNFLPAIKEYSVEMSDLVRRSVEQKNFAISNSIESMQGITAIESVIASLNAELDSVGIPEEGVAAFELLSLVGRLPYVYGTLLVEAVRRREWTERLQKDTSSLAEDMATFQEEEERRRKKWLKPIAEVVNLEAVQGGIVGFEMNVQPEKNVWPMVGRPDLEDYLHILQSLDGQNNEAEALSHAIKDLDRPTKQQIKRAKNFKMGSVHEPAFGKASALMVRGDDEMRVLKEANAKLEDELRGSKSRVRRLEDLLHRQSQSRRLSIGGPPPSFGLQSPGDPSTPTMEATSPKLLEEQSRRSSVSSRRFSTSHGQDEKRRLVRLEQELATEREARTNLEKDAQARRDKDVESQRRFEEAMSTKNNIMENMKAQQREFIDERRSLEEEIQAYKAKTEEAEDELDRVLGSRDHERTCIDAKVQELTSALDQARRQADEQSRIANERISSLQAGLSERDAAQTQHAESLASAFSHLSPGESVPKEHAALILQLEDLAARSFNHQKELEQAIAIAQSEHENTRAQAQQREGGLNIKLAEQEKDVAAAREQLDTEKAKFASMAAELEDERSQLRDLRTKFAEGETGSEALRKRVEDEEVKVGQLKIQLAEKTSHINSLDMELMRLKREIVKLKELDSPRTHQRMLRARELSKRLYTQHERLVRLIEVLGFVITHENGKMVLQRASRLGNSTVISDTTGGLSRSTTATSPIPLKRFLDDIGDLSFLQWTESVNPEEEDQRYHDLIEKLDMFDLETFSDAVAKRMRDMEHTARKWQKEARAYRDKSHRFQADAHEKIAYRSFKEGDLALFLPTRNNAHRPWAAFNVGAPHFFLREQDSHRLQGKEWLVARISKVEERMVDLSKALESGPRASLDGRSIASSNAVSFEDDNPFELSDGLRWYLLDATEEKPMAPGTPGIKGAVTVKSSLETGLGQRAQKKSALDPATQLGKSLDSRRSSGTSRKSVSMIGFRAGAEPSSAGDNTDSNPNSNTATRGASPAGAHGPSHLRETETSGNTGTAVDKLVEDPDGTNVRKDLLWGP